MSKISLIILSIFLISSCITPKVYNELLDKHEIAKKNLTKNEKLILELRENLDDKERDITNLNALVEQLRKDSIALNNDLVVITIHGIDGKLVFEKNFHNFKNQQSIDITNLKEGIYFAQIKTNNGFANIKFIKKT